MVCTTPPIWVTTTMPSDQVAALSAGRNPKPRHLKLKLNLMFAFFQANKRISACDATPRVAPPDKSAICSTLQFSMARVPVGSSPNKRMKATSPTVATILFSTGAHMYGPKILLEFSTSPRIEYSP